MTFANSSHAVLEITVTRKQRNKYRGQVIKGKLALVDLAGRYFHKQNCFFCTCVSYGLIAALSKVRKISYTSYGAVNELLKRIMEAKS